MSYNRLECLLCKNDAVLVHKDYPGYQEPETYDIFHCSYCNTSFSTPRIDARFLYDTIYKNGCFVPGYDRYWNYLKLIKSFKNPLAYLASEEEMYFSVQKNLERLSELKKEKILEVGSGLGYLTFALQTAGYNVKGLDISQTAVDMATNEFGDFYIHSDISDFSKSNSGSIDIVILTEVIEHINEPLKFIEQILLLLKPGGHIIITTPNKSLLPNTIVWKTENPPVHCWWFSEESLSFIAVKNNCTVSFFDFTEYYKPITKYVSFNTRSLKNTPTLPPTLTKENTLINPIINSLGYSIKKRIFLGFPLLKTILVGCKKLYIKQKEASNPDIIVCKKRGTILCATITKPK